MFSTQDVFEPLSLEVIKKLSLVSMGALYAALNTAQACAITGITTVLPKSSSNTNVNTAVYEREPVLFVPFRETECISEQLAVSIVEKALELFDCTYAILKTSYRVFPAAVENHFFLGAWVLFTGLHACLSKDDKMKSPVKLVRSVSQKILLNFNNLFVALTSHALYIFDVLVSDASFSYMSNHACRPHCLHIDAIDVPFTEDIPLCITEKYLNPSNRIRLILTQLSFIQFLLDIAFLSYKKSTLVRKISKSLSSNKQSYYLEELSDESVIEEDEDSEPILGLWFEETIANLSEDTSKKSTEDKSSGPKERERDTSSNGSKKFFNTSIQDKGDHEQVSSLKINLTRYKRQLG